MKRLAVALSFLVCASCGVNTPPTVPENRDVGVKYVESAIELTDELGVLHRGLAIVSVDSENDVEYLLEGLKVIRVKEDDARKPLPLETRKQQVVDAFATAPADAQGLAALLFDDDVAGWRGVPKQLPRPKKQTRNIYYFEATTWDSTTYGPVHSHSGSYFCTYGAEATGVRDSASTTPVSSVSFFKSAPWPNGSFITGQGLSDSIPSYTFGFTNASTWHYLTQDNGTCVSPAFSPCFTHIQNAIGCYQ